MGERGRRGWGQKGIGGELEGDGKGEEIDNQTLIWGTLS